MDAIGDVDFNPTSFKGGEKRLSDEGVGAREESPLKIWRWGVLACFRIDVNEEGAVIRKSESEADVSAEPDFVEEVS